MKLQITYVDYTSDKNTPTLHTTLVDKREAYELACNKRTLILMFKWGSYTYSGFDAFQRLDRLFDTLEFAIKAGEIIDELTPHKPLIEGEPTELTRFESDIHKV